MEADMANHVWSVGEIVALIEDVNAPDEAK